MTGLFASVSLILLTALSALSAAPQDAASPQAGLPEQIAPYLSPQRRIRVAEERTINLVCLGQGSPTIVMTAGLESWSIVWRRIQAPLSLKTRVCAWDPAGFGFSSPSPEPQDAVHLTEDLEQTLKGASLDAPYVLVAHSAGAFVALRFADKHRKSVVGMVLVDPSIPDQEAVMKRVAPKLAAYSDGMFAGTERRLRQCAAELRSGALKRATPDFDRCTAAPSLPAAFSGLTMSLARLNANPARLENEASAVENFRQSQREAIKLQRRYGDMPLIVLTAGRRDLAGMPAGVREQAALFYRVVASKHDAYAALSTRGNDQLVPNSGHDIPVEKPSVVLAAINRVLAEGESPSPKPRK